MKSLKVILLGVCFVLLVACNGYFIYQSSIPDTQILIGTVSDGGSMDFTNAHPLGKDDVHTVLLALIQANPAEQERTMETVADAVFSISKQGNEVGVYVYVWKTTDGVIISSDINNASAYKCVPSGLEAEIKGLLN